MSRFVGAVPLLLISTLLPRAATGLPADGAPSGRFNLPNVVVSMADGLSALSSEAEAQAFFFSRLAPILDVTTITDKTTAPVRGSDGLTERGGQLATELAAWQLASSLRQAAESGDVGRIAALQPRLDRQRWLLTEERLALRGAARLLTVLTTPRPFIEDPGDSEQFHAYQNYMDETYPDLAGTEQSWVRLVDEEGPEGLTRRLMGLWRDQPPSRQHEAMAARYFDRRLRPIFMAYLGAHAERAEAQADRQAQESWMQLRGWGGDLRQRRGLMRLCGTWQWTVHNHQNHQDHKMTIAFPSPEVWEGGNVDGVHPAQILVHGDGVYLRWVFQNGIQEDSLLFGKDGQRLEGTFVNSAGAWGSISAKRTSPCHGKK